MSSVSTHIGPTDARDPADTSAKTSAAPVSGPLARNQLQLQRAKDVLATNGATDADVSNKQLRAENALLSAKVATLEAQVAKLTSSTATPAPPPEVTERKPPGEGRNKGREKIPEEVTFEKLECDNVAFLRHLEITGVTTLQNKLATYCIALNKTYWTEDKGAIMNQCRQRAEFFLNLVCFQTDKWTYGNVGEMFDYLLGSDDLGTKPGQFRNRDHQIATWFWPNRVSDYASFKAETSAAKYIERRAHAYMTSVRAMHGLFEVFDGKREYPIGHREGIDPTPERKVSKKRKELPEDASD